VTRCLLLLIVVIIVGGSVAAQVRKFEAGRYATADGALLLNDTGNYVEPYFATKALLVAQSSGLDTKEAALAWIRWLLPRQLPDGRFERYCLKKNAWAACSAADADDSMLALWMELLYRNAPDSGLPQEWQHSANLARSYLRTLRNERLGVYHVSHRNHAALFMDNVEVYSALAQVARSERRFGDAAHADADDRSAQDLAKSIANVFWNERQQRFLPSNEKSRPAFYPDVVAQTYPWLAGMPTPEGDPHRAWTHWRQVFAPMWLNNRYDPHAWGLVAMAAVELNDTNTAGCWLDRAEVHRGDGEWNILEEAAFQAVDAAVARTGQRAANCASLVNRQ
jgi:hypothetical protein